MSEDGAHEGIAVPIAASLAEFTDKLIARRGVEQSNLLFGGQIGPATKALSARTSSIGVGDKAPDFSLPTADGGIWIGPSTLLKETSLPWLSFFIVVPGAIPPATFISVGCSKLGRSCPTPTLP